MGTNVIARTCRPLKITSDSSFSVGSLLSPGCLLVMLMGVINIMLKCNVLAGARWWPGDRTIVAAPYHGRSDGRLCRLGKTGLASSCVVITSHRPVLRPPEPQGPFTAAEVDHIEGKRTRINEKSREEKARRAFFKQICLSACFKQSVLKCIQNSK